MSRPDLTDILALSRYVSDLLKDYVAIHDAITPRASILGVLLGLFKPIDFQSHRSNLERCHSQLAQALIIVRNQKELPAGGSPHHIFLAILDRYIVAVSETVGRLQSICERLNSKIQRPSAYRWRAYRADMNGYHASIQRYRDIGKQLNQLLPTVNRSEPLSEHDLSAAPSTERSRHILALARELSGMGKSPTMSISDQLGGSTTSEQSQRGKVDRPEELFALCESDTPVRQVMERHGANRDTLRGAYARLLAGGAGGWVGGHYVAVSALAYGPPLEYVLSHFHEPSSRAVNIEVAFRLNEYFERRYETELL